MRKVTITIAKDGKVKIDNEGFVGEACNVTTALEKGLGIVNRSDKDDLYKNEIQLNEYDFNS